MAAELAARSDIPSLHRAVRLQPWNADYQDRLGRLYFASRSPAQAIEAYRTAVSVNPYSARYWFDLASAYQLLGFTQEEQDSLQRGLAADATTAAYAWEAAQFYAAHGQTEDALKQLRAVLRNDPYLPPAALQLCWSLNPDADALLREELPPLAGVHENFLEFLISEKESAAAAKVWRRLAQLQQPIPRRYVLEYIRYLIGQREVEQARSVWSQAALLSGLTAYESSSQNLVVNADFSQPILNGGFDWMYQKSKDVSVSLDATQPHGARPSLLIAFDSQGIEDAGIRQLIPVQPGKDYEFSAFYKTEKMQGAGGPRFAIEDSYEGTSYLASDDLKDAQSWTQISGSFTAGPDTTLVVLRIQRFPTGRPIRGKLWIHGIRLSQTTPSGS